MGRAAADAARQGSKTLRNAVVLSGAVLLTLGLELASRLSLKMPGHRALPGALAILMFASMFSTPMLVAFCIAVPCAVVLLGPGQSNGWMLVAGWLVTAALAAWLTRRPFKLAALWMPAVGAMYGLMRFASLPGGLHATPNAVRLGGHLVFGLLGGVIAWLAIRRTERT